MMIKKFNKFKKVNEATLRGNKGLPEDYLDRVSDRAKERLGVREGDHRAIMSNIHKVMSLVSKSSSFVSGNEKQLEELAHKVIINEYSDILDGVDINMSLGSPFDVKSNADKGKDNLDKKSYAQKVKIDNPKNKEIDRELERESDKSQEDSDNLDVSDEIDKRKIVNSIIQGEAKNTKHILHSEIVADGLKEIYGEQWEEVLEIWSDITKISDKLDWMIPVDNNEAMPAGSVRVEWSDEDDEDEGEDYGDDIEISGTIHIVGVDFPMLIHEAVKGIYEFIGANALSDDEDIDREVLRQTSSVSDEKEEFKFGPEIASDIRDFINASSENIDKYDNIREYFYGKMMQLPTESFLKLTKEILLNTDIARSKVDSMLKEVINELDEFYNEEEINIEDLGIDIKDDEGEGKEDLSKLSKSELQKRLDYHLDNGNYDEVRKISKFI